MWKTRLLAEGRGEVGKRHEGGVDFFDDFAVGFGFVADGLPFGVVLEGFPVGGGGFAAGVRDDVDERFALQRVVCRSPVGDVLDAVLFEELHGVIAKAAEKVVELAFVGMVDAEFVDRAGGLRGVGQG